MSRSEPGGDWNILSPQRRLIFSLFPACERVLGFFVFGLALALYLRTLAPSITWKNNGGDSGDLITAAFTGGIPHPPGYPLYTMLAGGFIALPGGDVAYRVNLLSALSAAATVLILFAIARQWLDAGRIWRSAIAAASALLFATSSLFWSQATIAEVYSLNALLVACAFGGLLLWSERIRIGQAADASRRLGQSVVAIAFGLGLAHHLTILLLLPAAVVLLWRKARPVDLAKVAAVALVISGLIYLTLLPRALRDAPTSWGDIRSWDDFWWLVSAQIYHNYLFGLPWIDYLTRLSAWAKSLFDQFGIIGVAIGMWGSLHLYFRDQRVGFAVGSTFVAYTLFAIVYSPGDSYVYLIPAYLVFTLAIAEGWAVLVVALQSRLPRSGWLTYGSYTAMACALFVLPLANGLANFSGMDQSQDTQAVDYAHQVFTILPNDALVVPDNTDQVFALWYYRFVEHPESRVIVAVPGLLVYPWYRDRLTRQNPDWEWPDSQASTWDQFLRAVVVANIDRHAVFWTNRDSYFQQLFQFRPVGNLFQVQRATQP